MVLLVNVEFCKSIIIKKKILLQPWVLLSVNIQTCVRHIIRLICHV